jgi:hypothetical protein
MGVRLLLNGLLWLALVGPATGLTATPTVTPTRTVTPTGPLGALTVAVGRFGEPCQGALSGVTVTVQPLGISQTTSSFNDGLVIFVLPPGAYTLVVDACSPNGCWPARVVEVVDGDNQFVRLCPLAFTPTATPTPTASPTPRPTGVLGEKTTTFRVFDLLTALPIVGAPISCTGPREEAVGASDGTGLFDCTLELRDSDTVLMIAGAPGFAERRRGYNGLDLWNNPDLLQVGLIPDGLCGGDCDADLQVDIAELVRAVGFVLGNGSAPGCPLVDLDGDGRVAVNDVVAAVTRALSGCPL